MKRIFGILFITISILIAFSNLTIIGAVIGMRASDSLSWIAIAFFVVGIVLLVEREGNLALKVKESGAVITDPKKLKKIARKMSYDLRGVREGTQVLNYDGRPLTVIPHRRFGTGTYYNIITALATGESSFRRRHDYSHA